MKAVLAGAAGVGKSTLFNALTESTAKGGRTGASVGTVLLPDRRIDQLVELYEPRKITPIEYQIVDPGMSTRASKGSGLPEIYREAGLLVLVIGAFAGPLADGTDEVVSELCGFDDDLILHDLAQVERRQERLVKEGKAKSREADILGRLRALLEDGRPARTADLSEEDWLPFASFVFLSRTPMLAVINIAESDVAAALPNAIRDAAGHRKIAVICLCAELEAELAELAELPAQERAEMAAGVGIEELAKSRFLTTAYRMLDRICFLTAGEDEVRAWPIRRGATALEAAGKIHSDIQRGFIRAEVTSVEDLLAHGDEAGCRKAGVLRLEGKEYVVKDGDVINFRFAV
ncbi:MAG: redox-regulated ATPase YchF [Candidatus Schekmanbacteria bacterium]|nr:redox-regulated ATPase YchF [Candidatus Schekmanbacteria bacterium]